MGEIKEAGKWYEDVPYLECKSIIRERLNSMSKDFIAIGYYLKYIRDKKLYKADGYTSIWEFAEDNYGIKTSTASRWMAMNDKFSQDGNTPLLDDRYQDFGKSQLQEMLYLDDEQMEQAKPDMPAKEIRAIRKPEKKSFEECVTYKCNGCCDNCHYEDRDDCPYDRTGYKIADWRIEHDKRTREEHDRIRAQEESESIDVLDFSVRVYNVLKRAGIDTVDKLRNTPDSELVKIRHLSKKCLDEIHSKLDGYNPEESPAKEKPEVLHFTADDKSIDNAYGAMIAELVGNYLDNAYKSPDGECEASVFGQTYKVLKRPEVTVFYTEDGQTFFDVENARLEQEYQWRQKNKPKLDIPEIEEVEGFAPAQQEEPEPEQVSGDVIGFEDDKSIQKWQELLPDIPLFTESTIKDFLWDEEKDLREYLEVDGLPFKVLSRKQMTVAGLRLLLRLTGWRG